MLHNIKNNARDNRNKKIIDKITTGDVNSKNFWDQLNRIGRKDNIDTTNIVNDEGSIICNPKDAINYVEKYYCNLYTIREPTVEFLEFDKEVKEFAECIPMNLEMREEITSEEVIRVIKTLNIGKSIGPDHISKKLLKLLDMENIENLTKN